MSHTRQQKLHVSSFKYILRFVIEMYYTVIIVWNILRNNILGFMKRYNFQCFKINFSNLIFNFSMYLAL